jgi:hypothetical protein
MVTDMLGDLIASMAELTQDLLDAIDLVFYLGKI